MAGAAIPSQQIVPPMSRKTRTCFDDNDGSKRDWIAQVMALLENRSSPVPSLAGARTSSSPYFAGTKCISFSRQGSLRETPLEWKPAELAFNPIARSAMRERKPLQARFSVGGMSSAPLLPIPALQRHAPELIHSDEGDEASPSAPGIAIMKRSAAQNLPLAARRRVGHIGLVGDVAEWLKAAVC
jgi:hypothetical protein